MTEYVTVEQVDAFLGPAWAPPERKAEAVFIANVWMGAQGLPDLDPHPPEWERAAAYIAREAAAGRIYGQTEYGLISKSASAGEVSSAKTFARGHRVVTAGENLALVLLKPWLGELGAGVVMLKRI